MKVSKELKAGTLVVLALVGLLFFINFLKGKNVFYSGRTFYAIYDNVNGLEPTSAVTINGLRVGRVEKISFHKELSGKLLVQMQVYHKLKFSKKTIAKIYSRELIGGKAVALNISQTGEVAQSGDTLNSELEMDVKNVLFKEFDPLKSKFENAMVSFDNSLSKLSKLLDKENRNQISQALLNINKTLISFEKLGNNLNKNLDPKSGNIISLVKETENTMKNINRISESIKGSGLKNILLSLELSLDKLNQTMQKIEEGRGTLGMLINDKKVYQNLQKASSELNLLLKDLRENPKRYVHFSIFGRKNRKINPK